MVQAAKKAQVLAASQPRVKAQVASRVVSDLSPHSCRFARGIVPGQRSGAASLKQQRCQDSQQRGFACSIYAEQSHRLTLLDFQGNTGQGGRRGWGKRLEKRAPAT